MQDNLLAELYERAAIVGELDGPQIEAWVSGLFPVLDDDDAVKAFVGYCAGQHSTDAALVCLALAELTAGLGSDDVSTVAEQAANSIDVELPPAAAQIGLSSLIEAWRVDAPFGRSIVLGFENAVLLDGEDGSDFEEGHSILVEVSESGELEDLQLTGPPAALLAEASADDDRVQVGELHVEKAIEMVVAAWPAQSMSGSALGPGVAANQQFVRRRIAAAAQQILPAIMVMAPEVDVRRGLSDAEYLEANRAALSTLRAAVGEVDVAAANEVAQLWASVIRGDAGDVSARERDALLWLEWADWLGAGIGMTRAGAGCEIDGVACVDFVNRCPEVSSTIEKRDREYAEWAFDVALDLLQDSGAIENGKLTSVGHQAVLPALHAAWGELA